MTQRSPLLFPPRPGRDFEMTRINAADYPGPEWPCDAGWEPTDVTPLEPQAGSARRSGDVDVSPSPARLDPWEGTIPAPLEDRLSANQRHRLAGLWGAFKDMYKAIIHSGEGASHA